MESFLMAKIREIKEIQKENYEMLDYVRTQVGWILEDCRKYDIPLADIEKANC